MCTCFPHGDVKGLVINPTSSSSMSSFVLSVSFHSQAIDKHEIDRQKGDRNSRQVMVQSEMRLLKGALHNKLSLPMLNYASRHDLQTHDVIWKLMFTSICICIHAMHMQVMWDMLQYSHIIVNSWTHHEAVNAELGLQFSQNKDHSDKSRAQRGRGHGVMWPPLNFGTVSIFLECMTAARHFIFGAQTDHDK